MTDWKQLIAALEGRIIGGGIHKGGYIHVPQEEAESILALLKEQEPHLLTLDEVCGGGECWIEGINGTCGYADCVYIEDTVFHENIIIDRIHSILLVSSEDYMRTWRCWDRRPTEEQRKAVKWDT